MSKDIEDLFKDGFEGFEQQPKNDMWDKIVQKRQINNLTNNASPEVTPEHIYSKEFTNFETQPAEKVWSNVLTHINNRRQQKKYTRWSLLLLLLIGSCSSLVWLYENKGDGNLITVKSVTEKGTKQTQKEYNNNIASTAQTPNTIKVKEQTNTNSETKGNTVVNYNKRNYRNAAGSNPASTNSNNILVVNEPFALSPNDKIVDEKTKAKNIEIVTTINEHNKRKEIAEALTNKELTNNTALLKPDSIATSYSSAKKKEEKKIPETKGDNKWWHGPSYFKYTSETDMNNEESNWKFGASVGNEWPIIRFKGNSNDPQYTQFRTNDESRAFSYNAQGFAIRQLGKLLFVQIGLGYSSFAFNGDYRHSIYKVQTITTPQGNTIYDTLYSYKINAQSQYRSSYVEVPIILGLHLGESRFNYDIKTGYIYQILQSQSGSALSPTTHQLEPIGATNQLTANRFGATWIISCKVNYQIKHELSVFIEPSLRYNLNALLGNAAQQQYINSLGLSGGFKFHID